MLVKRNTIRLTIITTTIPPERVPRKIPKTDNTHSKKSTPAISRKGRGSIPIMAAITRKIRRFQSVTEYPFIEKRTIFGTGKRVMGVYPRNQRIIRIRRSAKSIILF